MRRLRPSGISAPIIASFILSGCGGGGGGGAEAPSPATYSVGGTVSGLVGSGLTFKDSSAGGLVVFRERSIHLARQTSEWGCICRSDHSAAV
jgi:hypothetical protein